SSRYRSIRGQSEHHGVVRWHLRGEGEFVAGERPQQMVRFEAFPVVDAGGCTAGGKYVREIERVRVAHRHDQKAQVISTETPVDLHEIREQNEANAIADDALWHRPAAKGRYR